jgi:hypothetical protein
MRPRWEGDARGRGVATAAALVKELEELQAFAARSDWVAEGPDVHLLPHLEQACAQPESAFVLVGSQVDDAGRLIVDLQLRRPSAGLGQVRDAIIGLIGKIAETATYIRQYRDPLRFEVLTGEVPQDSAFAPHGHTLAIRMVE